MALWDCPTCKKAVDEGEQKCPFCSKSIRCLFCNAVQRLQRTSTKCEKCAKSLLEAPKVRVALTAVSNSLCTPAAVATPEEALSRARKQLQDAGAAAKSPSGLFIDRDFTTPSKMSGGSWSSFHDMKNMSLFGPSGMPAPQDTLQGELGDCWLISVMALLAHHQPALIKDLFVTTDKTDDGVYGIRLWVEGSWVTVVVDSYLPINKSYLGRDNFMYAHSQPGTTCWAALLEKAVAKVTGGYESLQGGGQATEAFLLFTGLPTTHFDRDDKTVEWTTEFLTNKVVTDINRGEFVAVTCTSGTEFGLSKDHVYSVLAVNNDHGEMLLQLRNPWGMSRYTGVNGPENAFSVRANKMEEHRKTDEVMKAVTAALCPVAALGQVVEAKAEQECKDIGNRAAISRASSAPDGVFWMPFSLFVSCFSDLYVCLPKPGDLIFTEPHVVPQAPRHIPTDKDLQRMVIHVKSSTTISVFCTQRSARAKDTVYADMMVCVCPIADPSKKGGGLFSTIDYTKIEGAPQLSDSAIHQTVLCEFKVKAGMYAVFPISVQCSQKVGTSTSSAIHMSVYTPRRELVVPVPSSSASLLRLIPAHVLCYAVRHHPKALVQPLKDVVLYTLISSNLCIAVALYEKGLFGGSGMAKITTDYKGTTGMLFVPKGKRSCSDVPAGACAVVSMAVVAAHTGKYQCSLDRDIEVAFSEIATKVSASSENDLLAPVKIKQCF